jgi:hypothetical protein
MTTELKRGCELKRGDVLHTWFGNQTILEMLPYSGRSTSSAVWRSCRMPKCRLTAADSTKCCSPNNLNRPRVWAYLRAGFGV